MPATPYEILEVPTSAKADEIKKAYRKKSKKAHPDMKGGSQEAFIQVENAYAVLANPIRRERFDKTGSTKDEMPFEKKVASEIQRLAAEAVQNGNFTERDLIAFMKQTLGEVMRKKNMERAELAKEIKRFEDLLSRIQRIDGGENVIAIAFENQIQQSKYGQASVDEFLKLCEAMKAELENFKWRIDEKPKQPAGFTNLFYTGSHVNFT